MKFIQVGLISLVAVTFTGCASVDNAVMSPPGGVYSSMIYTDSGILDKDQPQQPSSDASVKTRVEKVDWLLPIVEVSNSGFIYRHSADAISGLKDKDKPPVYLAYDLSRLKRDRFDMLFSDDLDGSLARNLIVCKVLDQSNKNFNNYYARVMGFDRGNTLIMKSINAIATAATGGASVASVPGAVGLGTATSLLNSTQQNFKDSFLGGGTVGSVLDAMQATRDNYEVTILNKLYDSSGNAAPVNSGKDAYPIEKVLADIDQLTAISTLDGALKYISQESAAKSQSAQQAADKITSGQKQLDKTELQKMGIQ